MSKQISELHKPVALAEAIEILGVALQESGSILVDCTLGLGGHTEAFLEHFDGLTVVGIDRDPEALKLAQARLSRFGSRVKFANSTYDQIAEVLDDLNIGQVEAVLLDLGVSSMQLDSDERGFAYSYDTALDMRMNQSVGITAADVVNDYSEADLARIFSEYGEERYAKKIAGAIVAERKQKKFSTSTELAALVAKIVPFIPGKSTGHPAKRVFQALRIEVNGELEILEATLPSAISKLKVGGRILVMSYHSLEDKIVKIALQKLATSQSPLDMPVELPEHAPVLRILTKGAMPASETEKLSNPRSTSVRIRAAEKIRNAA